MSPNGESGRDEGPRPESDDRPAGEESIDEREHGSRSSNPKYAEYEEDDDIASLEATTVHRDEDGNILPRKQFVEELNAYIVAKPLLDTARERFLEEVQDPDSEKEQLTDADLAELFDTHLVAPDFTQHELCESGRITERFVREGMTEANQDAYYIGILLASDEYEYVARLRRVERGTLTDAEIEFAMRQQDREEAGDEGPRPQGNRSERQTRRDRAERRGG
jgi:hypothetical protein